MIVLPRWGSPCTRAARPILVVARSAGCAGDAAAALADLRHDSVDDALRGDRQPAVVQDGAQLLLVDRCLQRQERTQLRIAVLLDDENDLVLVEELRDLAAEREGADAHVVDAHAARLE